MDNIKEMELEILITIRNNQVTPCSELCKLFDNRWPAYGKIFNHLYDQTMIKISGRELVPATERFELTPAGNLMISKLLEDRSHDIHAKIAHLQNLRNLRPATEWNPLSGLMHFLTPLFSPFKRPVH